VATRLLLAGLAAAAEWLRPYTLINYTVRVIILATRSSTVHRCDGSDKFGRQLISVSIPTANEVLQRQLLMSLMTINTRTDALAAATTHGPRDK